MQRLKGNLDLLLLSVLSFGPRTGTRSYRRCATGAGARSTCPRGPSTPPCTGWKTPARLASTWAEAEGRRRRVYGLTDQGVAALAAQQTEWRKFAGGVHAGARLGDPGRMAAVWGPAAAEPGWSA